MLKSKKGDRPLVLGILGGGQLAKMLALAGYRMGLNIATIDKEAGTPAGDMTQAEFSNGWTNEEDLKKFIEVSDVVTLENEFIDTRILREIEKKIAVYPSSATMDKIQDKFVQKTTFAEAGIPVPDFAEINLPDDAIEFGENYGYPFLLKTRLLGYDGYGNFTVNNQDDIKEAFHKFIGKPLLAEKFVNFKKELAVMVARSVEGEVAVYPCVETVQENHICHTVIAPAEVSEEIRRKAEDVAVAGVKAIRGVGVFGVELFLDADDSVLVNEIAPRPHNSGHYTIEGCETSQYENCIRAVLGLPLGSTEMVKPAAVMINLLGNCDGIGVPHNVMEMLNFKYAKLHLYNKKLCRKGRKMGHITALGDDIQETLSYAQQAADALEWK